MNLLRRLVLILILLLNAIIFGPPLFAQSAPGEFQWTSPGTPNTYQFTPSGNHTSGNFFFWDFGDGQNSNGFNPTHTYASAGVYPVVLNICDEQHHLLSRHCDSVNVYPTQQSFCSFTTTPDTSSNNTFTFQVQAQPGYRYYWDFGDFNNDSGSTVTHTFSSSGIYDVCLYQVDSGSNHIHCQHCDDIHVGGHSGNYCNFTSHADSINQSLIYFTSSSVAGTTVSWNFGDGNQGSGNSVAHYYALPGNYNACMVVADSVSGNILCVHCDVVCVSSGSGGFNCNFHAHADTTVSGQVNFDTQGGVNTIVSWDFGDGNTGTGDTVSNIYASTGYYHVCLSITDLGGAVLCTHCDWYFISVSGSGGSCNFTADADSLNPLQISFDAQSTHGNQVTWDFGDGNHGSGFQDTHIYATPGQYNVCMEVSDSSTHHVLCSECHIITVNAPPPPHPCHADFIAVNLGLTGFFIDLSRIPLGNASWLWDFGDSHSSSSRFPTHTYAAPGTYSVCLTISDSICNDQFCAPLTVDTIPVHSGNCEARFVTLQRGPFLLAVINLSSGLNLNFNWDFGDGSTSNLPYPSHFYSTTGSYNLCLTVSNSSGCSDTFCDTVSVDSSGNIVRMQNAGFTINVLAPNQLTGVEDLPASEMGGTIYPNPVSTELHVNFEDGNNANNAFRVCTLTGAEISSGNFNGKENVLDTRRWNPGIYILEIINPDGLKSYRKIVKEF